MPNPRPSARKGLADARKRVGHTQDSFSREIGVCKHTVSQWEIGNNAPSPRTRPKLARALSISLEELDRLIRGEPLIPPDPPDTGASDPVTFVYPSMQPAPVERAPQESVDATKTSRLLAHAPIAGRAVGRRRAANGPQGRTRKARASAPQAGLLSTMDRRLVLLRPLIVQVQCSF
jgi:transcriptional regulator with XRE-family HTH domain